MFLKRQISTFTGNYWEQTEKLKQEIEKRRCHCDPEPEPDFPLRQGCPYSGERFEKNFADFHEKYGIQDMYSGGFYPYDTLEEYLGMVEPSYPD